MCKERKKANKGIFIAKCVRIPNICSILAAQRKGRQKTEKIMFHFAPYEGLETVIKAIFATP